MTKENDTELSHGEKNKTQEEKGDEDFFVSMFFKRILK